MSDDMILVQPVCKVVHNELSSELFLYCGLPNCHELLATVHFKRTREAIDEGMDSVLVLREGHRQLKEFRDIPFYGPGRWINGIPLWIRLPEDKRAHLLMFYCFDWEKLAFEYEAICQIGSHQFPVFVACVCRGAVHFLQHMPPPPSPPPQPIQQLRPEHQ